jgi:tRNA modification GTPase
MSATPSIEAIATETIVAVATPPGYGAVSIVRLSGPAAFAIATRIIGRAPQPGMSARAVFRDADGERIDDGLVLAFRGPRSYTGEDVVELQGHGGAVVSEWLLETALAHGARAAKPGEFTLRAFLNDKIDLAQAEAVADLIDSGSRAAARAAARSLAGRFSDAVNALQRDLTALRVQIEAHLDFPDEDIDAVTGARLEQALERLLADVARLHRDAQQGVVLRDGISVAIAGPPNAGKSSLLNRLAGYDVAIVTDIPGTTRDVLRERLVLDGLPVHIVDTAGLRATDDPIEVEGVKRAQAEVARADRVLWVSDVREGVATAIAQMRAAVERDQAVTLVLNKADLLSAPPRLDPAIATPVIALSALTGQGVGDLITHLKSVAGWSDAAEGTFSARRRHLDAIERTSAHLEECQKQLSAALELAAEELRGAQRALSEITGEITSDDLLGEIFASFCIGK